MFKQYRKVDCLDSSMTIYGSAPPTKNHKKNSFQHLLQEISKWNLFYNKNVFWSNFGANLNQFWWPTELLWNFIEKVHLVTRPARRPRCCDAHACHLFFWGSCGICHLLLGNELLSTELALRKCRVWHVTATKKKKVGPHGERSLSHPLGLIRWLIGRDKWNHKWSVQNEAPSQLVPVSGAHL